MTRSSPVARPAAAVSADGAPPPYPAYRPSGVDWLGDIPAHWQVRRLKRVLTRNDSGVWGEDYDDNGITVLRSTDMTVSGEWRVDSPARRRLSPQDYQSALLRIGDLVMTKSSGSELHLGKTAIVTAEIAAADCCFSNFMQRLRVARDCRPEYVSRILNSPVGRDQLNYFGSTTTGLANLNAEVINSLFVPLPPLPEQRAIAAYLDRKTAKVDALVAKYERLIELLREKRSALISHAVTRGLDPDVPLKPSGVDWLGDIPAHWDMSQVRRLSSFVTSGSRGWAGYYSETGDIFLQSGNLGRSLSLDLSVVQHVQAPQGAEGERTRVQRYDVLVCITGALTGNVVLVDADLPVPAYVNQHVALARPDRKTIHPRYLALVLHSEVGRIQFTSGEYGGTKQGLGLGDVGGALVPVPPLPEQEAIVAYLDGETARNDALVDKVQEAVERLREYRTALISAAVTGKIDVRGAVEPPGA
ncbi:MAG: restriction endonuclease subunit S [Anaerolineae bacterium]